MARRHRPAAAGRAAGYLPPARIITTPLKFLVELTRRIIRDEVGFMAAAMSFYAWMCAIPLLLIAISMLGVWLGAAGAREKTLALVNQSFPALRDTGIHFDAILGALADQLSKKQGVAAMIGVLTLMWSGMNVVLATETGVNRAFGNSAHPVSWIQRRARALGLVLVAIGLAAFSIGSAVVVSLVRGPAAKALGWLISLATLVAFFAMLYRVLPRKTIPWRSALIGGLVTSVLWLVANAVLVVYFSDVRHLAGVYGSFAGVVIVLVDCYYVSFATLLGAEVTAMLTESPKGVADAP